MAIPEGSISLSQLASRYYLAKFGETPEQARSRDQRSYAEKLNDWQQDIKPEWAQREDEIDEDLVSAFVMRNSWPSTLIATLGRSSL